MVIIYMCHALCSYTLFVIIHTHTCVCVFVYMYKYVTYTCIWINRKQRLVYPPATLDTLQGGWQGATK